MQININTSFYTGEISLDSFLHSINFLKEEAMDNFVETTTLEIKGAKYSMSEIIQEFDLSMKNDFNIWFKNKFEEVLDKDFLKLKGKLIFLTFENIKKSFNDNIDDLKAMNKSLAIALNELNSLFAKEEFTTKINEVLKYNQTSNIIDCKIKDNNLLITFKY